MDTYESDNDEERPDSLDDKVRQKEMRKGIDLATTLERIEKNFVITDPRLPDNPIVRLPFKTIGFILTMLYKFCDLNFHHRDEDARCKYVISLSVCISDICI